MCVCVCPALFVYGCAFALICVCVYVASQNIGDLLKRYQQALETAVQISCRHNVPPLPGRTLILVSSSLAAYEPWKKALDIGCPIEPDQKSGEEGEEEECTTDVKTLTPNVRTNAFLAGPSLTCKGPV